MTVPIVPPIIDVLSNPPDTSDPENFDARADDFFGKLPAMVVQQNSANTVGYNNATSAFLSAQNSSISQIAAKASEDNARLYETTAQSAAAAAQSAAGLPVLKAGRVLRSPDGINVEFGNADGDVVYASQSKQVPLAKTVLANSINGLLELTTPSNPQPGDWFVVADQGNARTNNVVIKRAGTNLLTSPEDFTNAAWVKYGATCVNVSVGTPYGTTLASQLIADTSGSSHAFAQAPSLLLTTGICSASIYVKPANKNKIAIEIYSDGTSSSMIFNLVGNGSVGGTITTNPINSYILYVGDGWYRCSITKMCNSGYRSLTIYACDSVGSPAYIGDGVSTELLLFGGKFELGTSATFYDPVIPSQNLIPFSAPKITGQWSLTRVTAPDNSAFAPDGSMTAVTISEDSNNGSHAIGISHNPMASTYYTFSIDVAPIGRNWVFIELNFGGIYCTCWFDILTGVIGGNSGAKNVNISKNTINGYYRISISSPLTINTNSGALLLYVSTGNGISTYTGDGRAAMAIANAQLETGIIATPRIATNGAPATRTGNPTKIMGIADDLAIRRNYQNCRMTYQDDLMGWVLR